MTLGTDITTGQSDEGLQDGATDTDTQLDQGQPADQTTASGTDDVIFDPNEFDRLTSELPDELKSQALALRKSLQGNYSKKTQAIADQRRKIEAFDAFNKDPVGTIRRYAQQYGIALAQDAQNSPGGQDPESWDDVIKMSENAIMQKLSPVFQELKSMKVSAAERALNDIDPNWRTYEDEMLSNLNSYPDLANDPAKLYKLSVPDSVLMSRATQQALRKLEAKTNSSKISGSSTTSKTVKDKANDKPSFSEAVEIARQRLADRGLALK